MVNFTIYGRLKSMNDFIFANRKNPHAGNGMKRQEQTKVKTALLNQQKDVPLKIPIKIIYRFYEKDRRRDRDNIASFAHKVIQDAMVEVGMIPNDGWSEIRGFEDHFEVDKEHPRIEVTILEADDYYGLDKPL